MSSLSDLMSSPSFQRWATGRASVEEKRRWDSWVERSIRNRRLAILAQQRIAGVGGGRSYATEQTPGADVTLSTDEPSGVGIHVDIDQYGTDALYDFDAGLVPKEMSAPEHDSDFLDSEWQEVLAGIRTKKKVGQVGNQVQPAGPDSAVAESRKPRGLVSYPSLRVSQDRMSKRRTARMLMAAALLLVSGFTALMVQDLMNRPPVEEQVSVNVPMETVTTGYSEKRTLYLSDGTRIILAAGTSLSWSEDWLTRPIRQVILNSGEAYFIVEPREDHPYSAFEVVTEDGITSVLGTRFTVATYGDGTEVVLQEGEVEIAATTGTDESSKVKLVPGERAQWRNTDDHIALSEVNPAVYTSWTTDELFFEDTPLAELVRRIERTYGFNVRVEDPALLDQKLTGSVDFRSLDGLISAVSSVLEIGIRRMNDQILITQS